jgi:hypothetical protein
MLNWIKNNSSIYKRFNPTPALVVNPFTSQCGRGYSPCDEKIHVIGHVKYDGRPYRLFCNGKDELQIEQERKRREHSN